MPVRTTKDISWPALHLAVMKCKPPAGRLPDVKMWWRGKRVPQRVLFSLQWAPVSRPAAALVRQAWSRRRGWRLFASEQQAKALGRPLVDLFPARVQAVVRGRK